MYWATSAASKKSPNNGLEVAMPNVSIDLRLIKDCDVLTGSVLILTSKSGQMFSLKPPSGAEKGMMTEWVDQINVNTYVPLTLMFVWQCQTHMYIVDCCFYAI